MARNYEREDDALIMADEIRARLKILSHLGETLARRRDDLLDAEAEDIGTPCTAAAMEVDMAVEHLRTMALEVPYVEGKAPYGTVAAILPYDAPPVMLARVGGAAILGGNRFRFRSSAKPRASRRVRHTRMQVSVRSARIGAQWKVHISSSAKRAIRSMLRSDGSSSWRPSRAARR